MQEIHDSIPIRGLIPELICAHVFGYLLFDSSNLTILSHLVAKS